MLKLNNKQKKLHCTNWIVTNVFLIIAGIDFWENAIFSNSGHNDSHYHENGDGLVAISSMTLPYHYLERKTCPQA